MVKDTAHGSILHGLYSYLPWHSQTDSLTTLAQLLPLKMQIRASTYWLLQGLNELPCEALRAVPHSQ